jgi:hypothetical protein
MTKPKHEDSNVDATPATLETEPTLTIETPLEFQVELVVKGVSICHNGTIHPHGAKFGCSEVDAQRLLELGYAERAV